MADHHWKSADPVRVVQEVRRRGVATRRDLNESTGLSQSQLTRCIRPLIAGGFLAEDGRKLGTRRAVQLAADAGVLVGVDVTLDEVAIAISDTSYGLLKEPRSIAVDDVAESPGRTVEKIADAIAEELGRCDADTDLVIGVAMGIPGPVRRGTGIPASAPFLPEWSDRPVGAQLEQALAARDLGAMRCVVANDASLGGLGVFTRAVFHSPISAPRDLVYVRITHGIGAGIVLKGHLVTGGDGFAGEFGHMLVAPSGPFCTRCGARGCLETRASATAVAEEIRTAARLGDPGQVTVEQALASQHPARDHAIWEAGWHVGLALAQACNLLNPRMVVLGGAMTSIKGFMEAVEHAIERNALPQARAGLLLRRWEHQLDDERGDEEQEPTGPDIGANLTPELLGALAFVLDALGDSFLLPRVAAWDQRRRARSRRSPDTPKSLP